MLGIVSPKPRSFDENRGQFSDVVLTIGKEIFYVLKKFLASKSAYFNSMFFSNYAESGRDLIQPQAIDPRDFQNFLEAVHEEGEIDDSSIEGIRHLADMYIASTALSVCEKFLPFESKLTSKKLFDISKKYQLNKLADKCVSIMTINELTAVLKEEGLTTVIIKMLAE